MVTKPLRAHRDFAKFVFCAFSKKEERIYQILSAFGPFPCVFFSLGKTWQQVAIFKCTFWRAGGGVRSWRLSLHCVLDGVRDATAYVDGCRMNIALVAQYQCTSYILDMDKVSEVRTAAFNLKRSSSARLQSPAFGERSKTPNKHKIPLYPKLLPS